MTSRKFNPRGDSDKQTIPWATSLRATYSTTVLVNFQRENRRLFKQCEGAKASLAQNIGHTPRNHSTELEGRRKNKMGLSSMQTVYKHTRLLP